MTDLLEVAKSYLTEVREAKLRFEGSKATAKILVDRERAKLGLALIQARQSGEESQPTLARGLDIGVGQIQKYEQAYRDWLRDHPDEPLG